MNEISKLTDKILDEAKEYTGQAQQSAQRDIQCLASQFEDEANRQAQAILDAAHSQAEAILRRARSQAGIAERNSKLTARRETIDMAFARAKELLMNYPADKLTDFLVKLAVASQTCDAQFIWGRGDRSVAQAVVERVNAHNAAKGIKLTLSEQIGAFDGGFVLKEGSIETNCTFPVLIAAVADEMETQVAVTMLG